MRRRRIDAALDEDVARDVIFVIVARDVIFVIIVFLLAFSLPDLSQLLRQSADATYAAAPADAAGRKRKSRQRDASSASSAPHRRWLEQSGAFEALALRRHLREAEDESFYERIFI